MNTPLASSGAASPDTRAVPARTRSWQPILDGALGAAAEATALDILAAFEQEPVEPGGRAAWQASERCLLFTQAFRTLGNERFRAQATRWWTEAASRLEGDGPITAALHGGFAGVGWITEHVKPDLGLDDAVNGDIDEALGEQLVGEDAAVHFDLISGLAGWGVYFAERETGVGRAALRDVAKRLAGMCQTTAEGSTWWTAPSRFPPADRRDFPEGAHDVGVAHGVAGVVACLATACAAGEEPPGVRELVAGAVAWLHHVRDERRRDSIYPSRMVPGRGFVTSRTAWCYGDLGVAAALFVAGRALGNVDWTADAVETAARAATRDESLCWVRDAGLCHGACGLGHVFNCFYQSTGRTMFAQAARTWFARALAFRESGRGHVGFKVDDGGRPSRLPGRDTSLLEGTVGIALALLAATSACEPAWDRLLLLSTKPSQPLAPGA